MESAIVGIEAIDEKRVKERVKGWMRGGNRIKEKIADSLEPGCPMFLLRVILATIPRRLFAFLPLSALLFDLLTEQKKEEYQER